MKKKEGKKNRIIFPNPLIPIEDNNIKLYHIYE